MSNRSLLPPPPLIQRIRTLDDAERAILTLALHFDLLRQAIDRDLVADPATALEAATKQYVDAAHSAVTRTELGADIALVANTDTTIVSQALIMPTSGGPWRAVAFWSIMLVQDATSRTQQCWVDDQQGVTSNIFADRQDSLTAAFVGGHAGGSISKQSYADGAAVTLLLRMRSTGAPTAKAAAFAGPAQIKTYLQTMIVRD